MRYPPMTENEISRAMQMFRDGLPIREIAARLGRTHGAVGAWIRRRGLTREKIKRAPFDSSRKIDTIDLRPVKADPDELWREAMAGQRFEDVRVKRGAVRRMEPDAVEWRAL